MPHGYPDFGATTAPVTTYGLDDLGELAARLGSIVTFDRRGDVVFQDSFEDGLGKWTSGISEYAGYVDLTMLAARSGLLAVRFPCTAAGDQATGLRLSIAPPGSGRWGVEFSFTVDGKTKWVEARVASWDGDTLDHFGLLYDHEDAQLDIYSVGAGWTPVASGFRLAAAERMFHTVKLVFDVDAATYRRLILDGVAYDVSGEPAYSEPDASYPELDLDIVHWAQAGKDTTTYLDDVIITQNEP